MLFREIQLETHLLDELKTFYVETLGFKVLNQRKHQFTLSAGTTKLTFKRTREDHEPFYHFAVNIPENLLAEAKSWLSEKATLLVEDGKDEFHFEAWNAHAIYCEDPAGNIVEFIARHNLSKKGDAPFHPEQILSISEVGIPVEDVGLFCREVRQSLRLLLFDGNEKDFAALGDEKGLFIVVPVKRPWFPTSRPAGPFQPIVHLE